MQQRYDLHSHSTASDGLFSPTELIERASQQAVEILALTDHDSIAGLEEAHLAAKKYGVQLINGVEISTQWQNRSIHIVGLGFNAKHPALNQLLEKQAELRYRRAKMIGEKLEKVGIENAFAETQKLANGEVTRAHYARYLLQIGKVKTLEQAFKKYLAQGKSCYVKAEWVDIATAVEVLHQAGGVAVLAHPLRYKLGAKWIKKLIADFKQWGGDGIEVAGCGQTPDQRHLLANWATDFGLLSSQGSDFHAPCPWIELGKSLWLPTQCQPILPKLLKKS